MNLFFSDIMLILQISEEQFSCSSTKSKMEEQFTVDCQCSFFLLFPCCKKIDFIGTKSVRATMEMGRVCVCVWGGQLQLAHIYNYNSLRNIAAGDAVLVVGNSCINTASSPPFMCFIYSTL